jgi:hypothetical protein
MSDIFDPSAQNYAVLESFAFRAQVLLHIPYSEIHRPDDVIADDYFNTSEK